MTHPPNERNKTRRNKSEDGRRRGKKSNGRNVVVYVVVTFLAMMIQNKVVRSKDLVFAFAVGVLLLRVVGIQSCVPLLLIKWQKQERIMKMTKNMTSSFWVIVEKIENSQKIALFFAFFSHQAFFLAAPGDVPFSRKRRKEYRNKMSCVVLTLSTAIYKRNEKTT